MHALSTSHRHRSCVPFDPIDDKFRDVIIVTVRPVRKVKNSDHDLHWVARPLRRVMNSPPIDKKLGGVSAPPYRIVMRPSHIQRKPWGDKILPQTGVVQSFDPNADLRGAVFLDTASEDLHHA